MTGITAAIPAVKIAFGSVSPMAINATAAARKERAQEAPSAFASFIFLAFLFFSL
jgi:hypothetical protein